MNISRIYHGGPAGVSGGGGGGGGWPYAHGLVGLFWSDPIPINLDLGDLFTVALDPTTNNIQNPTGGTNGKFFTIGLMQHNAPGAPVTWGSDYVFNVDSLGNVIYPKIFYRAYDWIYIHFVKWYDKFHMVGQWPDFTHQISDSEAVLLVECLNEEFYFRGDSVFNFDSSWEVYSDSTEIYSLGDIDIEADGSLYEIAGVDKYTNVVVDWWINIDHDWNIYVGNYVWFEAENSLALWANHNDVSLDALDGKLWLGGSDGIFLYSSAGDIKHGATQAAAGAAAKEVWYTSGHASLPDNVLMYGA